MTSSSAHRIVSLLVLLTLLIQPLSVTAAYTAAEAAGPTVQTAHQVDPQKPGFLFRATVTLAGSRDLARLEKTGVLVLRTIEGDGAQSALILADGEQLADLARLGFKPRAADELRLLLNAQGREKRWRAESLAPLLAQADTAAEQWAVAQQQATAEQQAVAETAGAAGAAATPYALALQALRTSLRALTPEQIAGTADSVSVDDDADGLTNTQEAWWCTNPLDADTDDDGRTDGAEIQALKDWMGNQRESAPGETPWPSWPFNTTTCPDKDHDSIPNLAEQWELGLNMDLESSDRDKFDDGQELFGVTYCPGGDLSCGYGDLPRSSDSGYVGAEMPAWVKAPGKHPLVAAFPVPEVDVVESSLHVQTVTTVTTDHTIASGTEKSYSTAKTEGTSSSVADTITWNEWEEVSLTANDAPSAVASIAMSAVGTNALSAPAVDPVSAMFIASTALTILWPCVDDEIKGVKSSCRIVWEKGSSELERFSNDYAQMVKTEEERQRRCLQDAEGWDLAWKQVTRLGRCYPYQQYLASAADTESCHDAPPPQASVSSCTGPATGVQNAAPQDYPVISGAGIATQDRVDGRGSVVISSDGSTLTATPLHQVAYNAEEFCPAQDIFVGAVVRGRADHDAWAIRRTHDYQRRSLLERGILGRCHGR